MEGLEVVVGTCEAHPPARLLLLRLLRLLDAVLDDWLSRVALHTFPSEVDLFDMHGILSQLGEVVGGDLDTPSCASFYDLGSTVARLVRARTADFFIQHKALGCSILPALVFISALIMMLLRLDVNVSLVWQSHHLLGH